MTTYLTQGSATIYQFPVGGRAALAQRIRDERASATALSEADICDAAFDSWYHEAAIQESNKPREH